MLFCCADTLRQPTFQVRTRSHRITAGQSLHKRHRRGTIAVLSAVLTVVMFACVALALDVGYMYLARTQLQRSADSAALAGAASLYSLSDSLEMNTFYLEPDIAGAHTQAQNFVAYNGGGHYEGTKLTGQSVETDEDEHEASLQQRVLRGDVITGRFHDASLQDLPLIPTEVSPNTVQVTLSLANDHTNGSLPLFFARALGINDTNVHATASATLIHAALLPFATSADKWESLQNGGDGDNFASNNTVNVTSGESDGIPEITIFPDVKWDGSDLPPGNFGALSIGRETSSAADLRRQIDQGPTPAELAYHGALTENVMISGKTGVNATVKVAFNGGFDTSDMRYYEGIIGHPRYLPIFHQVSGNGTNSQFRIVKFGAVQVVNVNLKGKNKWVTLQPVKKIKNLMAVRLTR